MIPWLVSFLPQGPAEQAWFVAGMLGQALFVSRWLVQWWASEKRGETVVPSAFWWLSVIGGLIVLAYGLHLRNAVLILGQWGILIYLRNLVLLRQARQRLAEREAGAAGPAA